MRSSSSRQYPPPAHLFQPLVVHREAFDHILFQPLGGPTAEMGAPKGFYAISDRDNHIEIVQLDRSIGICNVQILHIAFLVQFAFLEYIIDMLGNNTSFSLKKFADLCLRQPNGIAIEIDLYSGYPIFRLVDDNIIIFVLFHNRSFLQSRDNRVDRCAQNILAGDDFGNALVQFVDIDLFARIGLFDIRRYRNIVVVLGNLAVFDQPGEMRVVLACDERIEYPRDVRIGQFVLVALVDELVGGVDK